MKISDVREGLSPLVLGFPHAGTMVPEDVFCCLNDNGRMLADTDWHIDRLYDGLVGSVTTVRALFHRYVIDVNRDPSGISLYPGQNTTSLVPVTDFDGKDIWRIPPDAEEIARRRRLFHAPYHQALHSEIERVKSLHGFAILYDCHSIRSRIPFLFEGTLPDFNVGTNGGKTATAAIEQAVMQVLNNARGYTNILNGRFRGGWTTRHYGNPGNRIYAIQMELAQSAYLRSEQPPFAYDEKKAAELRIHLQTVLETILNVTGNHTRHAQENGPEDNR